MRAIIDYETGRFSIYKILLIFFLWLGTSSVFAQDYNCADDLSPGSYIERKDKDYVSCLLLQEDALPEAAIKKKAYTQIKRDFRLMCVKDDYCKNQVFGVKNVKESCFQEAGDTLCQVTAFFDWRKTKYDQKKSVSGEMIRNKKFYRDKSSVSLSLTPFGGFFADIALRKTLLNHFGWQVGAAFYQEYALIGDVKQFATSDLNLTNPDYSAANNNLFTPAAGFMGLFGVNYNLKAGKLWLVPQLNAGFARIVVATDPWFGKDKISTSGDDNNEIQFDLTSGFTYFISGSVIGYLDTEKKSDWFGKFQIGVFGQSYMPLFISFGIGKQFSL